MDITEAFSYGAAALGGGGISKLIDTFLKRDRMRAYALGAVDNAVKTALDSVTAQLHNTDLRLAAVEGHHAQCQADLADVRKELAAQHRLMFEEALAGRVPSYGDENGGPRD